MVGHSKQGSQAAFLYERQIKTPLSPRCMSVILYLRWVQAVGYLGWPEDDDRIALFV